MGSQKRNIIHHPLSQVETMILDYGIPMQKLECCACFSFDALGVNKPCVENMIFLMWGLKQIWQMGVWAWGELQRSHASKIVKKKKSCFIVMYPENGGGGWQRELVAWKSLMVAEWILWHWAECLWGCFKGSDCLNRCLYRGTDNYCHPSRI